MREIRKGERRPLCRSQQLGSRKGDEQRKHDRSRAFPGTSSINLHCNNQFREQPFFVHCQRNLRLSQFPRAPIQTTTTHSSSGTGSSVNEGLSILLGPKKFREARENLCNWRWEQRRQQELRICNSRGKSPWRRPSVAARWQPEERNCLKLFTFFVVVVLADTLCSDLCWKLLQISFLKFATVCMCLITVILSKCMCCCSVFPNNANVCNKLKVMYL